MNTTKEKLSLALKQMDEIKNLLIDEDVSSLDPYANASAWFDASNLFDYLVSAYVASTKNEASAHHLVLMNEDVGIPEACSHVRD